MSEKTKTLRVRRGPSGDAKLACGQFRSVVGWTEIVVPGRFDADELEITIIVPKSRKERLREARVKALMRYFGSFEVHAGSTSHTVLEVIEAVDAEFAKGEPK